MSGDVEPIRIGLTGLSRDCLEVRGDVDGRANWFV